MIFFGAESNGRVRAPAYFAAELGDIDSIDLLEHNRVKVTFKQRNQYFVEILANPRFKIAHPKHLMEPLIEDGNVSVSPLDIGLVGTGPFALKRYERGSLIRLKRNEDYYDN